MKKRYLAVCLGLLAGMLGSCGNTSSSVAITSDSSSSETASAESSVSSGTSSSESQSSEESSIEDTSYNRNLYVTTDGGWGGESDDADGTEAKPFNFSTAIQYLRPGYTIYLKAGT